MSCRCSAPVDLPVVVPASSAVKLTIEIDTALAPDVLSEDVRFFIESARGIEMSYVELGLVFSGSVTQ